jgi:hypothetical protein
MQSQIAIQSQHAGENRWNRRFTLIMQMRIVFGYISVNLCASVVPNLLLFNADET